MRTTPTLLIPLLFLAACQSADAPEAVANDTASVGNTAEAASALSYSCDNGKAVTASYDNSDPNLAKATVTIDGKAYSVTQAVSASGARYTAENGPDGNKLFTWWTKGNEASWYSSELDHTAKPEDEKLIATCKQTS